MRTAMFVVAMIIACSMGAAISILSNPAAEQVVLESQAQISPFALMSSSKDLPAQSYDAF